MACDLRCGALSGAIQAVHATSKVHLDDTLVPPRGAGLVPSLRAKNNVQTTTSRAKRAANASSLYLAIT